MTNGAMFARGLPESVRLTETYRYHQEISKNSTYKAVDGPKGEMMVSVAYDGHRSFTHQALLDVQHQLGVGQGNNGQTHALIGHLAFANHRRTSLARDLGMTGPYNTLPLIIPVTGEPFEHRDELTNDRHVWISKTDYVIEEPKVWPISLDIRVRDENTVWPDVWAPEVHKDSPITAEIVSTIVGQLKARHDLSLSLRAGVNLPATLAPDNLKPSVTQIAVRWPRFTSLRSFELRSDRDGDEDIPLLLAPMDRSLVWSDMPMTIKDGAFEDSVRTFLSPGMELDIHHPGELYREDWEETTKDDHPSEILSGQITVEIPDWLLSGTQIRLFDGLGSTVVNPPIRLVTRFIIDFDLFLDDAFSRRRLSPRQHLYFDQVIPNDMRLLDVRTALADKGFRLFPGQDKPLKLNDATFGHYLVAWRPEGPDRLILWLVLEGKELAAERQSRIPGGHRYTSNFDSGELTLYVVGELPGNSAVLTREMNALQKALRERFNHLRSRR